MGQERDEIWTTETRLQPIHPKSDRVLEVEIGEELSKDSWLE